MNKKMRLKVATRLKRARERMNEDGKHWIQGAFYVFERRNGILYDEPRFCLVGGLRVAPLPKSAKHTTVYVATHSGAHKQDEVYRLALIEVARELGVESLRIGRGVDLMTVPIDEVEYYDLWAIEAVLTSRNDDEKTTWGDIEAALLKAEERMRA